MVGAQYVDWAVISREPASLVKSPPRTYSPHSMRRALGALPIGAEEACLLLWRPRWQVPTPLFGNTQPALLWDRARKSLSPRVEANITYSDERGLSRPGSSLPNPSWGMCGGKHPVFSITPRFLAGSEVLLRLLL
jgi:hypothetical protein